VVVTTAFGSVTATNAFTYDFTMQLAATEASDVVSFAMLRSAFGTLGAIEAPDVFAFAGSLNVFGPLAATDQPDVMLIRQQFFDDTDEFVLGGGFPLGAFGEDIQGVFFQISEPSDAIAFAGLVRWQLVLNSTEAPDTVNVQGSVYWPMVLDATDAPDVAAFNAIARHMLTLAATEAPDVAFFMGSTIANAEFETIVGSAVEPSISGRAIELAIDGAGIEIDLEGSLGAILSGRANRATLEGRETTP
jgi:hypothetical protein